MWVFNKLNGVLDLLGPKKQKSGGVVFKSREVEPILVDGKFLDVEIHGMADFTLQEKAFFVEAMKLKLKVLESEEFRHGLLNMEAAETKGMTQLEVYKLLFDGTDNRSKLVDHDIDLFITLYGRANQKSSTIGYSYTSNIKIWTHRYYFSKWMTQRDGMARLAGHILHEVLHTMGFVHNGPHSKSLVYKTGFLVRTLAQDVLKGRQLTAITSVRES